MQADWEVEIGGDAPVIDACWAGLLDLRLFPNRVAELVETQQLPALADALVRLNAKHSPVWTAKCDIWTVGEVDRVDRFELDAPPEGSACAIACYIDMLPATDRQWNFPQRAAAFCEWLCARLKAVPLRCCRIDLIVRRASIAPGVNDLGITAYCTACGATEAEASSKLGSALAVFADTVSPAAPPAQAQS